MKKDKLNIIEEIKNILENNSLTRDSDLLLYECIMTNRGYYQDITFHEVRKLIESRKLPTIETVTRARRKVQEEFPNLHSSEKVASLRRQNIDKYLEINNYTF